MHSFLFLFHLRDDLLNLFRLSFPSTVLLSSSCLAKGGLSIGELMRATTRRGKAELRNTNGETERERERVSAPASRLKFCDYHNIAAAAATTEETGKHTLAASDLSFFLSLSSLCSRMDFFCSTL